MKLNKLAALTLGSVISITSFTNANATAYQVFADLNFANPAALNSIKQGELIVGNTTLFQRIHFDGNAGGIQGSVSGDQTDALPFGRIAARLSPQLVASFDISQPYFTDIQYPNNNFANAFATSTILRDVNYSPKISYQVNQRLAVGAGVDFNHLYNGELSFGLSPLGEMNNKADSWGTGFDLGLFYVITPATFLNFSYYSQIVQHAKGESDWGAFSNNSFSADVKLPATWIVNAIQMLSPKWALSGTVRYTQWNVIRFLTMQHTAIPTINKTITIPYHLYNNASYELATHYQINDCWGALAAFDYEPNIQPTYTRNIGLPVYTRYIPAIGGEYQIAKGLKAKLIYAHVFSRPPINMSIGTGEHIAGTAHVNVDAWSLSLTYDV